MNRASLKQGAMNTGGDSLAPTKKAAPTVRQLPGFNYLKRLDKLLKQWRQASTERDRGGNRELYFARDAVLRWLYFCSPALSSLRDIQRATRLKKRQRRLGIKSTALGSLSDAGQGFDAALLEPVIRELAEQVRPAHVPAEQEAWRGLTEVACGRRCPKGPGRCGRTTSTGQRSCP